MPKPAELILWGLGLGAVGVGGYFALASVVRDEVEPVAPKGTPAEPVPAPTTRTALGYRAGAPTYVTLKPIAPGHELQVQAADAFIAMQKAAKADGIELWVASSFRDMAKQEELYALYKSGKGNLAAKPGYSNHQEGLSVDLATHSYISKEYRWLWSNANKWGFHNNVLTEHWHWTWMPGLQRTLSGLSGTSLAAVDANAGGSTASSNLVKFAPVFILGAIAAYQFYLRPDEGKRTVGIRFPDPKVAEQARRDQLKRS